jgi:hypothetical protein
MVWERDNGKCQSCGKTVTLEECQIDYITSLLLEGRHLHNLHTLCKEHAGRLPEGFYCPKCGCDVTKPIYRSPNRLHYYCGLILVRETEASEWQQTDDCSVSKRELTKKDRTNMWWGWLWGRIPDAVLENAGATVGGGYAEWPREMWL